MRPVIRLGKMHAQKLSMLRDDGQHKAPTRPPMEGRKVGDTSQPHSLYQSFCR